MWSLYKFTPKKSQATTTNPQLWYCSPWDYTSKTYYFYSRTNSHNSATQHSSSTRFYWKTWFAVPCTRWGSGSALTTGNWFLGALWWWLRSPQIGISYKKTYALSVYSHLVFHGDQILNIFPIGLRTPANNFKLNTQQW